MKMVRALLIFVSASLLFSCVTATAKSVIRKLPDENIPKISYLKKCVDNQSPIKVKVLVLEFNPVFSKEITGKEKNMRLTQLNGWHSPRFLAQSYMHDVSESSWNYVQYEIIEWLRIDDFPIKEDGFKYTPESYYKCQVDKTGWHQPDGTDYYAVINNYGIVPKVNEGEIDEVWMFGGPYFGFWESSMAGPTAFFINGGVYEKVKTNRNFVIMGFNYERGVAEMLHDLCHRTEATMTHLYGHWEVEKLDTDWARFAANLQQSGSAAAGTCHYPPNALKDYDYANPRLVESSADDWYNYPALKGEKKNINCDTWGSIPNVINIEMPRRGPDYQWGYMRWWFDHLPHKSGYNETGKCLNNWWSYVFEYNKYFQNIPPGNTNK